MLLERVRHPMKIYTKKGDDGQTGLFGGQRVKKTHARIDAYGTLDELNSSIGIIRALLVDGNIGLGQAFDGPLYRIQNALFQLGAELATPADKTESLSNSIHLVEASGVEALEHLIDGYEVGLPALKNFILPGGSSVAAHFHLARTICRRAERCTVALADYESIRPEILQYLNRLSDLLFVMARKANALDAVPETEWVKP